jgi:hypothetical protein
MRVLRAVPPILYVALAVALAAVALIIPLPFIVTQGVPVPAAVAAAPPVVYQAPPCLSPKPRHDYAGHKVDKAAGPGSDYKESKNAQGPSAVPANMARLTANERIQAVKETYIQRLCGGKKYGGDKKLFQLSFLDSDVNHLTAAPTHRLMNPNSTISRAEWISGLEGYLGTLRWDKSYLRYEKLTTETWTTIMVTQPGKEPLVKAVRHEQPKSWYLYLATTQPDGRIVHERKRLACNFQSTYDNEGDVPAVLKV